MLKPVSWSHSPSLLLRRNRKWSRGSGSRLLGQCHQKSVLSSVHAAPLAGRVLCGEVQQVVSPLLVSEKRGWKGRSNSCVPVPNSPSPSFLTFSNTQVLYERTWWNFPKRVRPSREAQRRVSWRRCRSRTRRRKPRTPPLGIHAPRSGAGRSRPGLASRASAAGPRSRLPPERGAPPAVALTKNTIHVLRLGKCWSCGIHVPSCTFATCSFWPTLHTPSREGSGRRRPTASHRWRRVVGASYGTRRCGS